MTALVAAALAGGFPAVCFTAAAVVRLVQGKRVFS